MVAPGDQNRRTTATREATGDSDRCRGGLFPVVFPAKNGRQKSISDYGKVYYRTLLAAPRISTADVRIRRSKRLR